MNKQRVSFASDCGRVHGWVVYLLAIPLLYLYPIEGASSTSNVTVPGATSIHDFGVLPEKSAKENAIALQKAIDWASPRGASLFVPPSEDPYPVEGGVILRDNVSLIGVHGPVGRGTRHPKKPQPVGSVFAIEDQERPFLTVENSNQIRGIQFWYPKQAQQDPTTIIQYPATIQSSRSKGSQGVTLSCLTFFGEYLAMDFNSPQKYPCEQILIEHCYGYPLGGTFVQIDYCYDIPRILHCHVNPGNRRLICGDYSPAMIDSVMARKSFAYKIDHTDNAQMMDLFTFGTWGGAYLGASSYGQLTNFNFDCVAVGIHKLGDNSFNRCWQIAQGSIIANAGASQEDIHPIIIEGLGHTSLSNVEAFAGKNGALTTVGKSYDYMLIKGNAPLTVTMTGCNMRNFTAKHPITILNRKATILAVACLSDGKVLVLDK